MGDAHQRPRRPDRVEHRGSAAPAQPIGGSALRETLARLQLPHLVNQLGVLVADAPRVSEALRAEMRLVVVVVVVVVVLLLLLSTHGKSTPTPSNVTPRCPPKILLPPRADGGRFSATEPSGRNRGSGTVPSSLVCTPNPSKDGPTTSTTLLCLHWEWKMVDFDAHCCPPISLLNRRRCPGQGTIHFHALQPSEFPVPSHFFSVHSNIFVSLP
jgi:hypothetical protein